MKIMIYKLFFIILFLFLGIISFFYYFSSQKRQSGKLVIVATTSIIADTIKNLVGDNVIIHCLMGPGVDPHLYRARESDIHKLAAADIIFYNGLHLEGKMGHILGGMNSFTRSVAVSDILDKILLRETDFKGLYDPHIWFDVSLWMSVVGYITEHLIAVDKKHINEYKMRRDVFLETLKQLHNYIKEKIATLPSESRVLITAHDAFGYFGKAYGMQVVGLQGLSTDSEISTKDIQDLAQLIVEKKIHAIFVESSIPQRALVAVQNAVAARGWTVALGDELYSDALGDHNSGASTYCDMLKHNIEAIVDGLQ